LSNPPRNSNPVSDWNKDMTMKMNLIVAVVFTFFVYGCATGDQTIIALNGTSRPLNGVYVRSSGGFGFTYGNMNPGISKGAQGGSLFAPKTSVTSPG